MSDDNSLHSSDTVNSKKGSFSLVTRQLFHGEPKNRDELLALIRDSGQNDLLSMKIRVEHARRGRLDIRRPAGPATL